MSEPPGGAPPPTEPTAVTATLDFSQLHRAGKPGLWRPVVGTIIVISCSLVFVPLVVSTGFIVAMTLAGWDASAAWRAISNLSRVTPIVLAYVNVVLGLGIAVVLFVTRVVHGLAPGWVCSVARRLRWRYLLACLVAALVTMIVVVAISSLLPQAAHQSGLAAGPNAFTAESLKFLLVIALLTPMQAAGEEFVYRGYLTQAFGGVFGGKVGQVLAVAGPALVFALAHGQQDLPIFIDRLAFGAIAGVLVIRTGGLEAGIAMHVINNWVALGIGVLFGDMSAILQPQGGDWTTIVVTAVQSSMYLALALWVAKVMGVQRLASAELVAPNGRV